jgi:three-Cys-motif partner protein
MVMVYWDIHKLPAQYKNALKTRVSAFSKWTVEWIKSSAGPGQYEKGEGGSPLIALKAFKEHRSRDRINCEVVFIFIEKDQTRAAHLRTLVDQERTGLPPKWHAEVISGVFDEEMTKVLNALDAQARHMAPAFVMIDPFGISGTPMSVVRRILSNPLCEVYISLMYREINRFKEMPEFEKHLDELFGCTTWRNGIDISDSDQRKAFFYDLYESQLRIAGAKHVVRFELYEGDQLVYAIFFGTGHSKGCDRLKQAIWKIAPFGDFVFRSARLGQLTLGADIVDYGPLQTALQKQFGGKGEISIEAVEEFVASDATDYHTSQLRKGALRPMEDCGDIDVVAGTHKTRRKHTYPAGTKLVFR